MVALKRKKSVRGVEASLYDLAIRARNVKNKGFNTPKWIDYCNVMLRAGYRVWVYEPPKSRSKYVTVLHPKYGRKFRVRFSNHKPITQLENSDNCDFFVGRNNYSISTTKEAIAATFKELGEVANGEKAT